MRLQRNAPKFVLMQPAAKEYKIKFTEAVLNIRQLRVSPEVTLSHRKLVKDNKPLRYPILQTEGTYFTIASQMTSITKSNVIVGRLPSRIFIGLVLNKSFSGDWGTNPLYFERANLTQIALTINGQAATNSPIHVNYKEAEVDAIEGYKSLYEVTGNTFTNGGLDLSLAEYEEGGFNLYGFKLYQNFEELTYFTKVRNGSVNVSMTFASPLSETMSVIVVYEHQHIVDIDKRGDVKII